MTSSSQPPNAVPTTGAAHLSPDEFRRLGHAAVDWVAGYWQRVPELPVRSQVEPGDIRRRLPDVLPDRAEPFDQVLADLDDVVLPGITHWQHPRFFAYFPATSSPPAVLAELLSAGIGAQGMIWSTSPALTEVEQVVTAWLGDALGLAAELTDPDGPGGGVIQDTASTATFTALLAALHRATGGTARSSGLQDGRRYAVYCSTQTHSSLLKAAMMSGVGSDMVREIRVDPATQAMDVPSLAAAVGRDIADGILPVMAVSAVGTTSTGAVDDTAAIGRICREHGIWLHVDAAWAGVAAVCPEHRQLLAGVNEYADSVVTNPHKWLLTTFDCSTFFVRDRAALIGALSIQPEYLRNAASESGEVVDYRDWHPQLGRRFRALKLWAVLRCYGRRGLQEHIRSGVAMAERFEALVRSDDRFWLPVDRSLSLVTFALREAAATTAVMDAVNASGSAYLTHTKVEDVTALRLAVGGVWTTPDDIEQTWAQIQRTADAVLAG